VHVDDLAEFTDTVELFAAGRRRAGSARGIATVHDSGAERALCADVAHAVAAPFAELGEPTLAAVGGLLDHGLAATNPLDVWGTGADTRTLFASCLHVMAADPAVAVTALAVDLVTEFDGDTDYPDAVLDAARLTAAPLAVLTSVPAAVDPVTATRLREAGIPVLEGYRSGISALAHLAGWPLPVPAPAPPVHVDRQRRWQARLAAGVVPSFELLADYGIPVVAAHAAASLAEVCSAAEAVGYPVALKTATGAHKSDVGGVVLGLPDTQALSAAYHAMAATLGRDVTVAAMAGAGAEISVGFVRDLNFGPLLVIAAGGVQVELHADRAVALAPVSGAEAGRLLDTLRIRPLLDGWRGAPPVAIGALVDVIVRFSCLAIELGDILDAVEANPVIVTPGGAVAVDVLVVPRT
jgi:acyl-CoA synthetase (NDP forming)